MGVMWDAQARRKKNMIWGQEKVQRWWLFRVGGGGWSIGERLKIVLRIL